MKTNITALCSMTDFSTPKLRLSAIAAFFSLLPFPAIASTVDIYRHISDGDLITLRVRVIDDGNVPIQGLNQRDFQILTTDSNKKSVDRSTIKFDLIPPEKQSQTDPVYVAILLDMSGSMRQYDSGGSEKLKGAIKAVNKFTQQAKNDKVPMKIALVPFGFSGGKQCNYLYEVDKENIAQNSPFYELKDEQLNSKLSELSYIPVCASTNLSQPLEAATNYLQNQYAQAVSNVNSEDTPKPRLAVILLTDGYDNSNSEQLQNLQRFLQQPPKVTVHTLGYGESLRSLRDRAQCSLFIPNDQLTPSNISRYCRLPNQDIRAFIIDESQMEGIATATGGIYKLSANADEVAKSLTAFLTTLREYELVYRQPGAAPGTSHQTRVQVNSPSRELKDVISAPENIRISNFQYTKLSLGERFGILLLTTILGFAAIFLFWQWSQKLKKQAEQNLNP
ncbi:von Willebrand factor type A [Cylindrospermum sp. NIES-4074]|nr:von Willebrand factor type A [Cylindrospermum sp. NIES-4074]